MRGLNTVVVAGAASLSILGCAHSPSFSGGPNSPLGKALGEKWTMVPLPDSRLGPGAIVQIESKGAKSVDVIWVSDLAQCGVDPSGIKIVDGDVPSLDYSKNFSINGDLSVALAGISGAADASTASTATLKITKASAPALDFAAFNQWMSVPANTALVKSKCGGILSSTNIYIVREAFEISTGSMAFTDKNGANITVNPPSGAPVGKVSTGVASDDSNTVTVNAPLIFAIRGLKQIDSDTWNLLGASSDKDPLSGKSIDTVR